MKITDYKMTKKGNVALFCEGEFLMSIHPDVFATSGLSVGSEVDVERLNELSTAAELKKAKEKALTLLSYKEFTAHELEERLKRHVDGDFAEQAVTRMEELGLINDDDYAERFARDLSERRHYGILRVKQEMRRKGLSPERIEFAISLLTEDPTDAIRAIVEKKYPLAYEDEAVKRRAYGALMRMGYPSAEIRRALSVTEYD